MSSKKRSMTDRFLSGVERVGNKLPHPITLFFILAGLTLVLSWVISLFGVSVIHPVSGEGVEVTNLLSKYGIRRVFSEATTNFTGFAPLGTVLVAMLGVGVADKSGLISAFLKKVVLGAPDQFITAAVVFAGIMSNVASDAGYVVLVPLGAIIFAAKGRHPLVGLAAAFAGVSGGFSANLIVSTLDPLLAGLTQEAAQLIDPTYTVAPTVNWYFMIASTFLITLVGTWVTEKVVAPRFGEYTGDHVEELEELTDVESKGLKWAGIWLLVAIGAIVALTAPQNGILRNDAGQIIEGFTPFVAGMVPMITLFFFVPVLLMVLRLRLLRMIQM